MLVQDCPVVTASRQLVQDCPDGHDRSGFKTSTLFGWSGPADHSSRPPHPWRTGKGVHNCCKPQAVGHISPTGLPVGEIKHAHCSRSLSGGGRAPITEANLKTQTLVDKSSAGDHCLSSPAQHLAPAGCEPVQDCPGSYDRGAFKTSTPNSRWQGRC